MINDILLEHLDNGGLVVVQTLRQPIFLRKMLDTSIRSKKMHVISLIPASILVSRNGVMITFISSIEMREEGSVESFLMI